MSDVRAILASDIHLSQKCPVARSSEESWFDAMARPLAELRGLASRYDVPVVYAGDIFDRWNASAEVINFALRHLPPGYAVPGQHDLPNHSYEEIKRTAYWTLVEAGLLKDLKPGQPTDIGRGVVAHGFPWGHPPKSITQTEGKIDLAVVHAFIYDTPERAYPGAPPEARASVARAALAGFSAAVYGDNHRGFIDYRKGLSIINCGGFMRRKSDERDYRPGVGLLLGDGTIKRHYLDTSAEAFIVATEAEERVGKMLDMSAFVDGLESLGGDDVLNFEAALRRFLETNGTEQNVARRALATITDAP